VADEDDVADLVGAWGSQVHLLLEYSSGRPAGAPAAHATYPRSILLITFERHW
jgi:hypothetical protein